MRDCNETNRTKRLSAAWVWAILLATANHSLSQEWTRFRGPNGSGISHAKTIPTKIIAADINWKVELAGSGHSSPVLWGGRIFVTCTGDRSGGLSVVCLSGNDGKVEWKRDF